MYWFLLLVGGLAAILLLRGNTPKHNYLKTNALSGSNSSIGEESQAVDLQALYEKSLKDRIIKGAQSAYLQLGKMAALKIAVITILCFLLATYVNHNFVRGGFGELIVVFLTIEIISLFTGYRWLKKRAYKQFNEAFPEALNILASAIGTGESIVHAIVYVGKHLDGDVGNEFKVMGERLLIGEKPESVFRKACTRFPYSSFLFFVIVLNANIQRGGQLKLIITRLNRMIFNERAAEKKKMSLTAEARASVKIVAAVPFVFLFAYQFISPESYEFVMHNPKGHYLLYYLIASNAVGFAISSWIMRD
ncbi:type II secretion system F family protein [Vibrio sp. S4M6]|uniref:type II secretion system F family protein n=1 Tax=Vibrio sinus TaxID=2946865 RepID=UPI002029EC53|nr:type II secretion system F family protein [Vibrio sinus]MCL9780811.1 type II secretion system F family protein [Vibrio sinus]